jgi:sialate O-acetylesterase
MKYIKEIITAALLFFALGVDANITLPAIFSDHMVLQTESTVTVWGWAKPNEVVRITCSWNPEKEYKVKVDSHSSWKIDIETPSAGGPYQLLLQGYNTIEINDILIGEVWLGSGQSNMEMSCRSVNNAKEEIAGAHFPEIRFFTVSTSTASSPQQLLEGEWVVCTPESMKNFSAIMYFFGRELHNQLKVPVGLINSSWGGTPVEIWISGYAVTGDRLLNQQARLLKPVQWGPIEPGVAYNSMIHPLIPFRIRGALWYQGEANVDYPGQYARALRTLIETWRASWGYDFPFYFAQIAPWSGYGSDNVNGAILRDRQRKVLDLIQYTGMAVLSDIGDLNNIHPTNKQDAAKRLAAWALHHDYGFEKLPFSGPLFRSYETEKGKVILHFDDVEGGLIAKDGPLREFEVLDHDGTWVETKAYIVGDHIEVESLESMPLGVRFAYSNDSNPNLFNKAGLPASCFEILMKNPLAKEKWVFDKE